MVPSRARRIPIAATLSINHLLDAQMSAPEHERHRLHGPQRGGEGIHRSGHPRPTQTVNPDQALIAKLQELLDPGADLDKYASRWTELRAGG